MTVLDDFRLDDRVLLLTGAGRGLGRALALAFAGAGADLVCVARSEDQLNETAELVRKADRRALVLSTDVTDSAAIRAMVERALQEFGRIDVLVNNAGGRTPGARKPLPEITDDEWRIGIETNLASQFYCARAVVPAMLQRGGGAIINIASGYGLRGGRDNYVYVAAKAAVVNLTRSLALTYGPHNIRVNGIAPGAFPLTPEARERWRGGRFIPVGRYGRAWELGPLAVFLASDAARGINGETIVSDGGGLAAGIAPTAWAPRVPLPGGVA